MVAKATAPHALMSGSDGGFGGNRSGGSYSNIKLASLQMRLSRKEGRARVRCVLATPQRFEAGRKHSERCEQDIIA
jgi:hypothetical protein